MRLHAIVPTQFATFSVDYEMALQQASMTFPRVRERRIECLLIEIQLRQPISQVGEGLFIDRPRPHTVAKVLRWERDLQASALIESHDSSTECCSFRSLGAKLDPGILDRAGIGRAAAEDEAQSQETP